MKHTVDRIAVADALHCFTPRAVADAADAADAALLDAARSADRRWAAGEQLSPLDGVPVTVKANFCVEGSATTAGSRMLHDPPFVPPYTATAVARLQAAGAIVVARTNMDEFGMGSATAFSTHGATLSPYSSPALTGRGDASTAPLTAGGSSGGGAAATAVGAGLLALGSDTGGSVRQPAAFCGLVGLKPTYGRVSRWGLISYASSLDCPGVMGRSVADAWAALAVMAGPDPRDATSVPLPLPTTAPGSAPAPAAGDLTSATPPSLKGVRVGVPAEFYVQELPDDAVAWWRKGCAWLQDAGAEVVPVSLPHTRHALHAYYVIASAEASSNLARYDGVRYGHRADFTPGDADGTAGAKALHDSYKASRSAGFGWEVQRRLLVGSFVLSQSAKEEYYDAATAVRRLIASDFDAVLQDVDAVLSPTTPTPPWPVHRTADVDPVAMYANDVMTVPASLAGLPAVSVPVGMVDAEDGTPTPVGLQLVGRRCHEAALCTLGRVLECQAAFHTHIPAALHGGWPP